MSALFPPTQLSCERCHGHGHVDAPAGRLACLNCSAAANDNSPWTPASNPPVCEPGSHAGISIDVWGVVVSDDERHAEQVAYWPARNVWTATRMDGGEPADVEVIVSHWMELPEMPQEVA